MLQLVKTSSIGWATKAAAQGRSITRNSSAVVPSFDKSGEGGWPRLGDRVWGWRPQVEKSYGGGGGDECKNRVRGRAAEVSQMVGIRTPTDAVQDVTTTNIPPWYMGPKLI
jgi:hypothetical protein